MTTASLAEYLKQAINHHRSGHLREAQALYQLILQHQPTHPDALHLLGLIAHQTGHHQHAVDLISRATAINPGIAAVHNNLGEAYRGLQRFEQAKGCYRTALQLDPNYTPAHHNLGIVFTEQGDYPAAIACFRAALRLEPNYAPGRKNLALALLDDGCLYEAVAEYGKAIQLQPNDETAHSNLLYTLNLLPDADPDEIFAAHLSWGKRHPDPGRADFARTNPPDPKRRLRIGYVSRDFCRHAVAFFLEPILQCHDREQFEIYGYADVSKPDDTTARFQSLAHTWRSIVNLSDQQVAQQIRADHIDILVDLAGHTAKNRLLIFARRPAPVQASYLGYCNTTGLPAMDYLITDALTVPPNAATRYTETLMHLEGCFFCYRPPDNAPAVTPLPVSSGQTFTFGCFHKIEKLNHEVLQLWSQLLQKTPGSRLLIYRDTLNAGQQERLLKYFTAAGIEPSRLAFHQRPPAGKSYYAMYEQIDVSLDVFPWSGHTIACESLWMGAPVITLLGSTQAGRMVASLLSQVGLEDFIAKSKQDYLDIAAQLVANPEPLVELRRSLRDRIKGSPFCDAAHSTAGLESIYRDIWRRYCASWMLKGGAGMRGAQIPPLSN